MTALRTTTEEAWEGPLLLRQPTVVAAIQAMDAGKVRVATPTPTGWQVNHWLKKAVLLYFRVRGTTPIQAGPIAFHDKIPLKQNFPVFILWCSQPPA